MSPAASSACSPRCCCRRACCSVPSWSCRRCFGIQRYVIVSGSMTGTYDRGSVVFDQVVPVASLKVGDVITYRPPAGAGPTTWSRTGSPRSPRTRAAPASSAPRATRTGSPTRGRSRSRTRARRGSAPASRTSASPSPRCPIAACGCSSSVFPPLLIALSSLAGLWRETGTEPPERAHEARAARARGPGRADPVRVASSTATFVAASANPGTTFSTAADFNTVAVALADPGSPLRGTVALTATAASDRGIASVRSRRAGRREHVDQRVHRQRRPVHLRLRHPAVADGLRDIRARRARHRRLQPRVGRLRAPRSTTPRRRRR